MAFAAGVSYNSGQAETERILSFSEGLLSLTVRIPENSGGGTAGHH